MGGGNVPISVSSVLLSVGRPGKAGTGPPDAVVGPTGGSDGGGFVDRLVVVLVFVFTELGAVV